MHVALTSCRFSDIQASLRPFTEDIVTPNSASSQLVLWSRRALDKYCQQLVNLWEGDPYRFGKLLEKYHIIRDRNGSFNDMVSLGQPLSPWRRSERST